MQFKYLFWLNSVDYVLFKDLIFEAFNKSNSFWVLNELLLNVKIVFLINKSEWKGLLFFVWYKNYLILVYFYKIKISNFYVFLARRNYLVNLINWFSHYKYKNLPLILIFLQHNILSDLKCVKINCNILERNNVNPQKLRPKYLFSYHINHFT